MRNLPQYFSDEAGNKDLEIGSTQRSNFPAISSQAVVWMNQLVQTRKRRGGNAASPRKLAFEKILEKTFIRRQQKSRFKVSVNNRLCAADYWLSKPNLSKS
jgi:hypothetical protein